MQFADPGLRNALAQWRAQTNVERRSEADNLWFESRVSSERQQIFEDEAPGLAEADELRRAHADYCKTFVQIADEVPHTFFASLVPADLGAIDEAQPIVRIESLDRPLNKHGITFDQLKEAFDNQDSAVLDGFLRVWNDSNIRDWRPAFAAFKDEVSDDLARADWPDRLRNRLGLAHYDCRNGPIPIALMEYPVSEVRSAADSVSLPCAFTAPTVLDSGPWPYFFPAPKGLSCGRTMALYQV